MIEHQRADSQPTDQQLAERLREAGPEESGAEDLELIRQRLPHSPALRATLAENLQLERALHDRLGGYEVSVDQVLARAASSAPQPRWALWLACLVVLVAGVGAAAGTIAWLAKPRWLEVQLGNRHQPETLHVDLVPSHDAEQPEQTSARQQHTGPLKTGSLKTGSPKTGPLKKNTSGADLGGTTTGRLIGPEELALASRAVSAGQAAEIPQAVKVRRSESLLEGFEEPFSGKGEALLMDWLEPVVGHKQGGRLSQRRGSPSMEGLWKLRPDWPAGTALRLGLFDCDGLKIHVYSGTNGITLQCSQNHTWSAYRTTRGGQLVPTPDSSTLVATDINRHRRSWRGVLELRYQDGSLVLNRGEIRLLSVPLQGEPEEVFLEGTTGVSGLALVRPQPLPKEQLPVGRTVFRTDRPGVHHWLTKLTQHAALEQGRHGEAVLSCNPLTKNQADQSPLSFAALPLDRTGLCEVRLGIRGADAGSGIFLGDALGHPIYRVAFIPEETTGTAAAVLLRPDEPLPKSAKFQTDKQPSPLAGCWSELWYLRLIVGPGGTLHCHVSGDGKHFSPFTRPLVTGESGFSTVGLFCQAGTDARRIELAEVSVHEFSGLLKLVPEELRPQALSLANFGQLEPWWTAMVASCPQGVDETHWRRAVALATLGDVPSAELGTALLEGLAQEAVAAEGPIAEKLAVLDEIALLADLWEPAAVNRFVDHYRDLGQRLDHAGSKQPWTLVSRSLLSAPIWTNGQIEVFPESLVRAELIESAYHQNWDHVAELARRIEFYSRGSHHSFGPRPSAARLKPLIEWALAAAGREHFGEEGPSDIAWSIKLRHPLVEQLSKEGFNIVAEFQAALASESYEDACKIITTNSNLRGLGLLPDDQDRQLLLSLPGVVALAMQRSEPLRQTMEAQLGPVGQLRVKRAISHHDVSAIEAATVQFYGTQAAALAHQWLGDRALAVGNFAQASIQYQEALTAAGPQLTAGLAARRRLAGALVGQDVGQPADAPIQLGDLRLSADRFEALVASLRRERSSMALDQPQSSRPALSQPEDQEPTGPTQAVPPPGDYAQQPTGRFEGELGRHPENVKASGMDWAGRQMSVAWTDQLLLASNRFQVTAFDRATGKIRWQRQIEGSPGWTHQWSLVPMRLLVAGRRAYLRWLTSRGPALAALDVRSGDILWRHTEGLCIASDPIFVQDQLLAFCLSDLPGDQLALELAAFDPNSGQLLRRSKVAQFRNVWGKEIPCQAALAGPRLVAAVGGTLLGCTLDGRTQWLRRQLRIPPGYDPLSVRQLHPQPVVLENRVYVTQANLRSVECVDARTGQLYWRQAEEELLGLVGVSGKTVIVETEKEFVGYDRQSGQQLWRRQAAGKLSGQLLGSNFLYAQAQPLTQTVSAVALVWVQPASGRTLHRQVVADLSGFPLQCGPLASDGETLWGFFPPETKKAQQQPIRHLVKFTLTQPAQNIPAQNIPAQNIPAQNIPAQNIPAQNIPAQKLPPQGRSIHQVAAGYAQAVAPTAQQLIAEIFPGWQLILSQGQRVYLPVSPVPSGLPALVAESRQSRSAQFVRRIRPAVGVGARLQLRLRGPTKPTWHLEVSLDGQRLASVPVNEATAREGVFEFSLPLPPGDGQAHWLSVRQLSHNATPLPIRWERLRVNQRGAEEVRTAENR